MCETIWLRCWHISKFAPSLLLPSHVRSSGHLTFFQRRYAVSLSLSVSLPLSPCLAVCLNSTHLFNPPARPSPCFPLPPAHFSVDGDLSRPWLMLAQPPPPLCSLWWWGSLCCDTDARGLQTEQSNSPKRRLTWVVNPRERQRTDSDRLSVSKAQNKDTLCSVSPFFFFLS